MVTEKRLAVAALATALGSFPATASAHHEALFGPQSSLAVESEGFVSLQASECAIPVALNAA